ncbi:hypothetical protein AB0I24_15580 [Brachybacterium paraconglomeratum]
MSLIEHLELPATHGWIRQPPAASSEIAAIDTSFPDAPVSLEDSLRDAVIAALESASHLRIAIQSGLFAPAPFRAELRTILMGAGRLGYISLPTQSDDRREHAEHVLGMEARSLDRALTDIGRIEHLPGLRWDSDEVDKLRRKIKTVNTTGLPGDRSLIRTAADLIGREVTAADATIEPGVLRDHLTWIWHTASGSAHGFAWQSLAHGDFVTDLGDVLFAFHFTLDAAQEMWVNPENLSDAP